MRIDMKTRSMIKEAFDNLPDGVSYFNAAGTPILVNRTMHRLVHMLNQSDLQTLRDVEELCKKKDGVFPGDGTVWRFEKKKIGDKEEITEVIAADATNLYLRGKELEEANKEQHEIMERLESVGKNVISIARNEEILSMKMRLHNELGHAIGTTRRFITQKLSGEEKADYIEEQRKIAKMLQKEIGNDDDVHIFAELQNSAKMLGMEVVMDGEFPAYAEKIMTKAVLECLINTVRHAGGDKVYVRVLPEETGFCAVISNNGKDPEKEITEGGGLSSLRKSVENANGSMRIKSLPKFEVTITLPENAEGEYDECTHCGR